MSFSGAFLQCSAELSVKKKELLSNNLNGSHCRITYCSGCDTISTRRWENFDGQSLNFLNINRF